LIVVFDDPNATALPDLGVHGSALRRRIIRGRGMGRAAARNDGAQAAQGDVLLFLDGDMLTPSSLVASHRQALAEGHGFVRGRVRELLGAAICTDPAIGGPGFPAVRPPDLEKNGFSPNGYRIASNQLEQAIDAHFVEGDAAIPSWIASAGANFSVVHEVWDRLGGQNEQFGTRWGCEDLEFSYRAASRIGEIAFAPAAIGYHLSHPQPARWSDHKTSLDFFLGLHPDPAVQALEHLLASDGTLQRYRAALSRSTHSA
jgi:GT2 family glycosyltransferase